MFAHKHFAERWNKTIYRDFGTKRFVEMHGGDDPIVEVNLTESPTGTYWAWLATGEDKPSMIFVSEAQFRVCFTYRFELEVERGKGRVVMLEVNEI